MTIELASVSRATDVDVRLSTMCSACARKERSLNNETKTARSRTPADLKSADAAKTMAVRMKLMITLAGSGLPKLQASTR